MSGGVEQVDDADDFLRLTCCPWCGYSLATLPREGTCPECGGPYDQRYVVLPGRGRGRFDATVGGTWRGMIWYLPLIGIAAWVFSDFRSALRHPLLFAFAIITAASLLICAYVRLFSARHPTMQLWISKEGVAQSLSSGTPGAQLLLNYLWLLYLPLIFVLMFAGDGWSVGSWLILVIPLGWYGIVIWGKRRERRSRHQRQRSSTEGCSGLLPWDRIDKTSVTSLDDARARIRCETTTYFGPIKLTREPVVDIEVDLTKGQAAKLQRLIEKWSSEQRDQTAEGDSNSTNNHAQSQN